MTHKSELGETAIAEIKAAEYGVKELLSDNGDKFDNRKVRRIKVSGRNVQHSDLHS